MAIEGLVRLVSPPAVPVDADGDWSAVEAGLGLALPADYRALVGRYGLGCFGDIDLWTPFDTHTNGAFHLVEHAHGLVDFHAAYREVAPEDFPHPLYPEPGGLLEWASTPNGDSLCWLTGGPPGSWPVVVWNIRQCAYRYDVGAVELLHGFLSGQREVEPFGPAPAVPWFDPYRERTQVYVNLSEVDLPYDERLQILRNVLAPTADRGSFNTFGRRQDHFKALDRDWLLTYGNAGGPALWVAFPPGDDDEARVVIRNVAQAMGCNILGASTNDQSTWWTRDSAT